MSDNVIGCGIEESERILAEKSPELVALLESADMPAAIAVINEVYEVRHRAFFQEVGQLTREVHESIKAFGSLAQGSLPVEAVEAGVSTASESLDYVVEISEKSAHETMDKIDSILMLLEQTEETIPSQIVSLKKLLQSELNEVLTAQGVQDISGQLIRKVMQLLADVEEQLVQLVEIASKVGNFGGVPVSALDEKNNKQLEPQMVAAEGPQLKGKHDKGLACEQDEVDELLSSLGF